MTTSHVLTACAVAVSALLAPLAANATRIVDTAVAAPSLAGADTIDATDWLAARFVLAVGATLDSVAVQALDTEPAADAGQTFVLALYAAGSDGLPALDFNAPNQGRLDVATGTYAVDGWNGVGGLSWQLGAGSYWLAVEAGSDVGAVTGLALPVGAVLGGAGATPDVPITAAAGATGQPAQPTASGCASIPCRPCPSRRRRGCCCRGAQRWPQQSVDAAPEHAPAG